MASRGKTAVVVVTAEFEHLAHTMAANDGRAGLRVHVSKESAIFLVVESRTPLPKLLQLLNGLISIFNRDT